MRDLKKKCEYMKWYYSATARGRFNRLRDGAKTQSAYFDVDPERFIEWWDNQPKTCHYCNQPLTTSTNRMHRLSDMTVDRKDNAIGYILSNIVLACRRCNLMKGEWLTEQQTLEIAGRYFES